jgi:hypothetical protein
MSTFSHLAARRVSDRATEEDGIENVGVPTAEPGRGGKVNVVDVDPTVLSLVIFSPQELSQPFLPTDRSALQYPHVNVLATAEPGRGGKVNVVDVDPTEPVNPREEERIVAARDAVLLSRAVGFVG